jgi:hypothetical protein
MRYDKLDNELRKAYESLPERQRRYVDFRVAGFGKKDAYIKAGYKAGKNSAQAAYILERNIPQISQVIEAMAALKFVSDLDKAKGEPMEVIDAKASVAVAQSKALMERIMKMEPEEAERLQFYMDVMSGKIKTKKKVKNISEAGIVSYRVEEIEDVKIKFEARKEIDKILGLNRLLDIGKITAGSVTINIVDASKKDLEEEERPNHDIFKKTQEDVIVVDDDVKKHDTEDDIVEFNGPKPSSFKRNGVDVK